MLAIKCVLTTGLGPFHRLNRKNGMNNQLTRLQMNVTVAFVLLAVMLSWYEPLSDKAATYVDDGLTRSLLSFASARALNGVISVFQGTEVVVQPFGLGISLALGEILDPINDLVEAFSSVMLTATVAFGIQKLLLAIGSNWAVSAFVTGVALIWSLLFLKDRAPRWLSQLLVVLVFVRFVMPVTLISSGYIFDHLAAGEYRQSQSELDKTLGKLKVFYSDVNSSLAKEESSPPPPIAVKPEAKPEAEPAAEQPQEKAATPFAKLKGLFGKTVDAGKGAVSGAQNAVQSVMKDPTAVIRAKYEELKNVAEEAAERMVKIIVIFLMQTIVLPLILLWFLYRLSGRLGQAHSPRSTAKPGA